MHMRMFMNDERADLIVRYEPRQVPPHREHAPPPRDVSYDRTMARERVQGKRDKQRQKDPY